MVLKVYYPLNHDKHWKDLSEQVSSSQRHDFVSSSAPQTIDNISWLISEWPRLFWLDATGNNSTNRVREIVNE